MSIIGHETLTYSRARDQLAYAHGFPGTGRRNRRFIVPWPTSSSLSSPARVTRLSLLVPTMARHYDKQGKDVDSFPLE